jgi:hypothetical protein
VVAEPIQQGRTQQLWRVVITRAEDGKAVARGQVRLQNIEASTQSGAALADVRSACRTSPWLAIANGMTTIPDHVIGTGESLY